MSRNKRNLVRLNGVNTDLLDKYYMPGNIPTRDIMSELGDTPEPTTSNKVSFGILLVALFLLFKI